MFRYCAAYYLHQWFVDGDCVFWNEIGKRGTFEQDALGKLFKKYRVIRNIQGGTSNLSDFCSVLNKAREKNFSPATIPEIVDDAVKGVRKAYQKDLTSAVSKALWMMRRHPVAIFDSRAREALVRMGLLRSSDQGYKIYYEAWMELFNRHDTQQHLRDACEWLSGSDYARSLEKQLNEDELSSEWFRNRVFDMRLFFIGDPGRPYSVGERQLHDVLGRGQWP